MSDILEWKRGGGWKAKGRGKSWKGEGRIEIDSESLSPGNETVGCMGSWASVFFMKSRKSGSKEL